LESQPKPRERIAAPRTCFHLEKREAAAVSNRLSVSPCKVSSGTIAAALAALSLAVLAHWFI
jgi:hypothetical protein